MADEKQDPVDSTNRAVYLCEELGLGEIACEKIAAAIEAAEQAVRRQMSAGLDAFNLPRCEAMDGTGLRVVPYYTEAGEWQQVNCVVLTDGTRTAIYAPFKIMKHVPEYLREPTPNG